MSTLPDDFPPISLLCVDKDVSVLNMLKEYFEHTPDFSVFFCTSPSEALGLISQYRFDAIISDYSLPEKDGITFLKEIRARNDPALFIIFTGRHLAQIVIDTLNNGGNYYVQRGSDPFIDIRKMEDFIRTSVHNLRPVSPVPDIDTRYRSLVEQQPDLLCCFLPDGTCTLANAAFAHFIGGNEREVSQRTNFLAIVSDNERDRVRKLLSGLTPKHPSTCIEHHILNERAEPFLFQWSYGAFFNGEGTISEYLAQGRDPSYVVRFDEDLPQVSSAAGSAISQQNMSSATPEQSMVAVDERNIRRSPPGTVPGISLGTAAPEQNTGAEPGRYIPRRSSRTRPIISQQDLSTASHEQPSVPELANLADSIDQIQYPIFAIDKEGVVIAWNHAIAELTGIDARTIVGKGNYAYAVPVYGRPRPMLVDEILKSAGEPDSELSPDTIRDGDTYTGKAEQVTIKGKPVQIQGKGTLIFDSHHNIIAAVQSLLVTGEPLADIQYNSADEQYIGGVSGIIINVVSEVTGCTTTDTPGSAIRGNGVYVTDKRLLVVHDPEQDALGDRGKHLRTYIVGKLFGTAVDTRPRPIAEVDTMKVFSISREEITSLEIKTSQFPAGFVTMRTASGGLYRIFIDNKKDFAHLEDLLDLFYPAINRVDMDPDYDDLGWLDETRVLELVGNMQPENPFRDVPHEVTSDLPPIPIDLSMSVSQPQCREIAEAIHDVPYPTFAIDRQGIVIAWNKAIARLTGIEPLQMIGKSDFEYSHAFYGERKPMLIDYIIMPPERQAGGGLSSITRGMETFSGHEHVTIRGKPIFIDYLPLSPEKAVNGGSSAINREGDTFIGEPESVTIQGKPMLIWGKGTGIYDSRGTAIAAVQSILSVEKPDSTPIVDRIEEEQYLGGLSGITVSVPGTGFTGTIATAVGSQDGRGYGIYVTDRRIFIVHTADLDVSRIRALKLRELIMDELLGNTVDTNPRSIEKLSEIKVFEVPGKDIVSIEVKKTLLSAGHLTFRLLSGESFRVSTDHKMAFIHLEQLLRLYYPAILRDD